MLAVGLDVTVLNIALPTLSIQLDASTVQLQWFASGYTLVLAGLLLPAGMLGDRYGRRRVLLAALVGFGAASLWCAYAGSAGNLIAARVALGAAAAFVQPLSLSVFLVLFPDAGDRQRAMAVLAGAMMLGLPLGPILGGYLLQHFWWGSVFLVNIPLVVVAVLAAAVLVPESRGDLAPRVDVGGVVLSSAGLVGVTYGVIAAGEQHWTATSAVVALAAGAALLAAFVVWEQRCRYPLVDLGLFRSSRFAWGVSFVTLIGFSMFGLMFFLPLYFQAVQGSDTLRAGLKLLPMIAGVFVGTGVAGRVRPLVGRHAMPAGGLALIAGGLLIGATSPQTTGYGFTACWLVVLGLGLGLAMTRTMTTTLDALPAAQSGVGSALVQTMRQVGGALGVALLGALANSGYRRGLDVGGVPTAVADAVRDSVAGGVAAAGKLHDQQLLEDVRTAFVHAMDTTLLVSGGVAALAAILALRFPRLAGVDARPAAPSGPELPATAGRR
jgi:EmrB/QacA subfamily drug resistance transporter